MDMKEVPHRRVGIGQGFVTEPAKPILVVRARSGTQVRRGGFVGDETRPVAFVWVDEETEAPEKELVVQVGVGDIYLWQDGSPVNLTLLYPKEKAIARLAKQFEDWQRYFGKYYSAQTPNKFYWGRFHEEGRQLARRLQAELIDLAVVRYKRPQEDPQYRQSPEIEL
jgi:hypothetical protein